MQIAIDKSLVVDIIKNLYNELFERRCDYDDSPLEKKLLSGVGYKNRQDFIQQQQKNKEFMQELRRRLVEDIECNSLDWHGLCVQDFRSLRELAELVEEKIEEITKINQSRIDERECQQMITKLISQGYQVTKKISADKHGK